MIGSKGLAARGRYCLDKRTNVPALLLYFPS